MHPHYNKEKMGTTQPIRSKTDVKKFTDYYAVAKPNARNYCLIVLGLHTALRIGDILELRWQDVYQFAQKRYVKHLFLREKKTKKASVIALSHHVTEALETLRRQKDPQPADYIFSGAAGAAKPLCRSQAYRIVKEAARETLGETHISCHSLRKTFGYHAWKQGISPALLMDVYNHSSFVITRRYLGIDQDDRDLLFQKLDF